MQNNNTTPTDTTSSIADPPLSESNTRNRTNPKIIVVFTLGGMESPTIVADTEQEQAQMERILSRIEPCLDVADTILKKGCTEQTV